VDNIIIIVNDIFEINRVKDFLKSLFKIKDLGKLKFFLGIEVIDIGRGVCLTQRKYCLELFHEFGMLGCKPVKTPLDPKLVLDKDGIGKHDELLSMLLNFKSWLES